MTREKRNVVVIGGGASGIMAAIWAARLGSQVTIIEHGNRIGKKILATGNGRCNFTNRVQEKSCYRGENANFSEDVRKQFTEQDTLVFFQKLGMQVKEKNGYYYPFSEQASTVLAVLVMELERLQVQILTDTKIKEIKKENDKFICFLEEKRTLEAEQIILCAGSCASPKTGSDGSGYLLAKQMGHQIIKPLPALVPLFAKEKYHKNIWKGMAGVRTESVLRLMIDNCCVYTEKGELQLTEYGISGIPVFQFSRYAVRSLENHKKVQVLIDFLPNLEYEDCQKWIKQQMKVYQKNIGQTLEGLLNKKLVPAILKCAEIEQTKRTLSEKEMRKLLSCLKEFETEVTGFKDFEQAQVCSGGVDTRQVNLQTLESKLVKGLYFAGEILDVDGACGGYNLQWAWASGYVAGHRL